jgi:hypothetical protein
LVKPSAPAKVANVPVVGRVIAVVAVTVKVVPKLPEMVIVLAALFATPVPPWSEPKVPVETKPLDASVNTGLEAVKLDKIGCAVRVVTPAILAVVPTNKALAIPTPPAVMIEPVETLEESVVRLEVNPWAKVIRAVVVVCPSLVIAVVKPVAKSEVRELNAEDDMTVPATTG